MQGFLSALVICLYAHMHKPRLMIRLLQELTTSLMKQRKSHEGKSQLTLPFKHVLQELPDNLELAASSSTVSSRARYTCCSAG